LTVQREKNVRRLSQRGRRRRYGRGTKVRDFFDKFALLGTLAAIGFVDVVRGARAAGKEEAHGMSVVRFSKCGEKRYKI
jgi:hypothetical protein